jgi:hypothetical protein
MFHLTPIMLNVGVGLFDVLWEERRGRIFLQKGGAAIALRIPNLRLGVWPLQLRYFLVTEMRKMIHCPGTFCWSSL